MRYGDVIGPLISGAAIVLVGSDKVNETGSMQGYKQEAVACIDGLRFALATKAELVDEVKERSNSPEQLLYVGTEYPRTLQRCLGFGPVQTWSGKSEGMIDYYGPSQIQAIFAQVRSGDTLQRNSLVIVEDDIEPVTLQRVVAEFADDFTLAEKLRPRTVTAQVPYNGGNYGKF